MQEELKKALIIVLMGLIVLLHLFLEETKRTDADATNEKGLEQENSQNPIIVRKKIEDIIRTKMTLREIREPAQEKVRPPKQKAERSPAKAPKPRKRDKEKPILTTKLSVSDKLIQQGFSMIGHNGEMIGQFPTIIVHYRKTLGFKAYVESILNLGGRFFIFDTRSRRLISEIDFKTGSLRPIRDLRRLSPRSRDISGETAVYKYCRMAAFKYGGAHHSVVLLFPLRVDSFLIAGIDHSLKQKRLDIKAFSSLTGEYRKKGSALILKINSGKAKGGSVRRMNIELNLSGA